MLNAVEVPRPVGIAIVVLILAVLIGAIWWRTGQEARGRADAQQVTAAQEAQEFSRTPPPTVQTGNPDQGARD